MKLRQKLEADPADRFTSARCMESGTSSSAEVKLMAERKARLMDRLRMRTTLLIPLLLLCFGCTPVSLLILQTIVRQQVRASLASDLQHSVKTYQNLARQRRSCWCASRRCWPDLPSAEEPDDRGQPHHCGRRGGILAGQRQRFLCAAGSQWQLDCRVQPGCAARPRGEWSGGWRASWDGRKSRRCWRSTAGCMRYRSSRWCLATATMAASLGLSRWATR